MDPSLYVNVYHGNYEILKTLLASNSIGEDIDKLDDKTGWTALVLALIRGHFDVAELLLNNKADPYITDPYIKIKGSKNKYILEHILECSSDEQAIHAKLDFLENKRIVFGEKHLLYNIESNRLKGMRRCLESISVDWCDRYGRTLLMLSMEKKNPSMAKLLLEKGADPNKKDTLLGKDQRPGRTVLNYYAPKFCEDSKDWHEVLDLLEKQGAEPLEQLLFLHIKSGNVAGVKRFLQYGSVDLSDQHGRTLLMLSIENSQLNITKLLLEKGANPNIKDKLWRPHTLLGLTVLDYYVPKFYRAFEDWNEVLDLLEKKGAEPLEQFLFLHIKSGNVADVKRMIEKGVDINAIDSPGKCVLENIIQSEIDTDKKREIIELLIEKGVTPTLEMFHFCAEHHFQKGVGYCLRRAVGINSISITLALTSAVRNNQPSEEKRDVIKTLLKWGADPFYYSPSVLSEPLEKDEECFKDATWYHHLLMLEVKSFLEEIDPREILGQSFLTEFLHLRVWISHLIKAIEPLPVEIQLMIIEKALPFSYPIQSGRLAALLMENSLRLSELFAPPKTNPEPENAPKRLTLN